MVTIENAYAATAHAPNHVTSEEGVKSSYIVRTLDLNLPVHCTTIKGRLLSSRPMLKPFSGEKILSSVEMGPRNGGFLVKMGVETLDFGFATPKGTSLRGTASFDVFCVKIGARVSAAAFLKNQKKK